MDEVSGHYKEYSDEELLRIVTQLRHKYDLEFLNGAEQELLRRENLPVTEPKEAPLRDSDVSVTEAVSSNLSPGIIMLCFFIPTLVTPVTIIINSYFFELPGLNFTIIPVCLFVQYAIYRNIQHDGPEEKAIEFKMWVQNTWIVYGGVYLISKILSLLFGFGLTAFM